LFVGLFKDASLSQHRGDSKQTCSSEIIGALFGLITKVTMGMYSNESRSPGSVSHGIPFSVGKASRAQSALLNGQQSTSGVFLLSMFYTVLV
jgi:hypothetical protein